MHRLCYLALLAALLSAGCASGPLARRSPAADPRIDRAPMTSETKQQARAYFDKPSPKAFAFSPQTGHNRHAWGTTSAAEAERVAMAECAAATRTPCVLFAVDDRIVWEPDDGGHEDVVGAREAAVSREPAAGSAYLVGLFDNRGNRGTLFRIINLTSTDLRLSMAFFDQDGKPLHCHRDRLSGNGLVEVDVRQLGITAPLGVARVVALAEGAVRPQAGLIGSQRQTLGGQLLAEMAMQAVQPRLEGGQLCGW